MQQALGNQAAQVAHLAIILRLQELLQHARRSAQREPMQQLERPHAQVVQRGITRLPLEHRVARVARQDITLRPLVRHHAQVVHQDIIQQRSVRRQHVLQPVRLEPMQQLERPHAQVVQRGITRLPLEHQVARAAREATILLQLVQRQHARRTAPREHMQQLERPHAQVAQLDTI